MSQALQTSARASTPATRRQYLQRYEALKSERAPLDIIWRDIGDYTLPMQTEFLFDQPKKWLGRTDKILNDTPTAAIEIAASGLMGGLTSPARPWFRLGPADPDLAKFGRVKVWFRTVEERMRDIFNRSNFYDALAMAYLQLVTWGIEACYADPDASDVVRFYQAPIGTFAVALSSRMAIDTLYREIALTACQINDLFGAVDAADPVQRALRSGNLDQTFPILHVLEPNRDYEAGYLDRRGKSWTSAYIELYSVDKRKDLDKEPWYDSGREEFPATAARWRPLGHRAYSESPGMRSRGDIKGLQKVEKDYYQALGRIVRPPMNMPTAMQESGGTLLEDNINWIPPDAGNVKVEPSVVVDPRVLALENKIAAIERRIMRAFYADMFLLISQSDSPQKTAAEIAERHEEKMLQLGPALSRVHGEKLKPQIMRTLRLMGRASYLPPLPPELRGHPIEIEFISILAQAQKLLSTASVERFVGFIGNVSGQNPDILDLPDWDTMGRGYADMTGLPPDYLNSEELVAQKRAQRAQQKQAEQVAAAARPARDMAGAAQVLANTDASGQGDTVLNRLLAGAVPGGGGVQ